MGAVTHAAPSTGCRGCRQERTLGETTPASRSDRTVKNMPQESADYSRGLDALRSAAVALEAAEVDHWFFGGWAVDLWVGRLTRPHDDIDVLVWRRDAIRVNDALAATRWVHAPTPEDLVGTNLRAQ